MPPRIAISGTYSSGKTTTSIALAHLTGVPRTHAKTMREILPEAFPGKRLEDCEGYELLQLGIMRLNERCVHESHLCGGFISDGSSLHEWVYGKVRVHMGIHPDDSSGAPPEPSAEAVSFGQAIDAFGAVAQRHAKKSYDVFIHLPVEFPLVADGHRPVSERFRAMSDALLLDTLDRLEIPVHVVGGSIPGRLERIRELLALPMVMAVDDAVARAMDEVGALDIADEVDRSESSASVVGDRPGSRG